MHDPMSDAIDRYSYDRKIEQMAEEINDLQNEIRTLKARATPSAKVNWASSLYEMPTAKSRTHLAGAIRRQMVRIPVQKIPYSNNPDLQ